MKTAIIILAVLALVGVCSAKHYKPANETVTHIPGKLGYFYLGYYTDVAWGTIAAGTCTTNTVSLSGTGVFPPYSVYCGQDQNPPANVTPVLAWVSATNELSLRMCNIGATSAIVATMNINCEMNNWDY